MILYLDASALVKRYIAELGTPAVNDAIAQAELVGTVLVSRAEVGAALAKAVRMGGLSQADAWTSLQAFRGEWADLVRVQVTEAVIARADALAWEHGLRGYDAVHLAAAALWQDALGQPVTLATFDRRLWEAARQIGLLSFPADLLRLLMEWRPAQD